jgi:hypothetical protein
MTVKLPLTPHEEKLIGLRMEYRQILHYLLLYSDNDGLVEHPQGKPVAYLIAKAIDRHHVTVYLYLSWLKHFGYIDVRKHEPRPEHGKNHGHCVVLLNKELYESQRILDILTTPPNARFLADMEREKDRLKA